MAKTLRNLVTLGMLGLSCASPQKPFDAKTSEYVNNPERFAFYNLPEVLQLTDNVSALSLVYHGSKDSLQETNLEYRVDSADAAVQGNYRPLRFRHNVLYDGSILLTTNFSPASLAPGEYIIEVRGAMGQGEKKERYAITSKLRVANHGK